MNAWFVSGSPGSTNRSILIPEPELYTFTRIQQEKKYNEFKFNKSQQKQTLGLYIFFLREVKPHV